jgi:hypothetical protein
MMGKLIIPMENVGEISDGYHSFSELYEHRHALFGHLLHQYKSCAFKTWRDDKKKKIDGWFIAGVNTLQGQITYHIPGRLWGSPLYNNITEIEFNEYYDQHESCDVLRRLHNIKIYGI